MFIVANTIKVKKGYVEILQSRFEHITKIKNVPGFIELNFLQTRLSEEDYEEVIVWSKWESQKAHNEWVASDMFKKAHQGMRSEQILESKLTFYDVLIESNAEEVITKEDHIA